MRKKERTNLSRKFVRIGISFLIVIIATHAYWTVNISPRETSTNFKQFPTMQLLPYLPQETAIALQEEQQREMDEFMAILHGIEEESNRFGSNIAIILFVAISLFILNLMAMSDEPARKIPKVGDNPKSATGEVISKLFIPQFNAPALFLISLTFLLLAITNSEMRAGGITLTIGNPFILLFIGGMIASLRITLAQGLKTNAQKRFMLFFAVFVNIFVGLEAGLQLMQNAKGVLLIFPIWNIASAFYLLGLYRSGKITIDSIQSEELSESQIFLGGLVVFALILFCESFFNWHWTTIFSICVIYAMNIQYAIQLILILGRGDKSQ